MESSCILSVIWWKLVTVYSKSLHWVGLNSMSSINDHLIKELLLWWFLFAPSEVIQKSHRLLAVSLFRVLSLDGIIETVKRRRYYEKPCRQRQRENYENCKRIYNMEMARKLSFVSRTNRQDPWLGCWSARKMITTYVYVEWTAGVKRCARAEGERSFPCTWKRDHVLMLC